MVRLAGELLTTTTATALTGRRHDATGELQRAKASALQAHLHDDHIAGDVELKKLAFSLRCILGSPGSRE